MHKLHTLPLITLIVGVIAIGIAGYVLLLGKPIHAPDPAKKDLQTYTAAAYGLSFTYSRGYYLKEHAAGTNERPQLSLVLVQDTPENRAVIDGTAKGMRDGPTTITIDVYPNPDQLAAEDWVHADTNWTIRTSDAAPFGKGSLTGITYSWDGLYQGKSYVTTKDRLAYVFSVTWLTPSDPIVAEFDQVLSSVELSDPAAQEATIEDYVKAHIADLSPEKAVLGGTFLVTSIQAHGGAGTVSYEDGHNAFTADFTYEVDEKGDPSVRTFTVRK